jgi:hypothetical protein
MTDVTPMELTLVDGGCWYEAVTEFLAGFGAGLTGTI